MKKIVIIGNSPAGVKVAEEIRKADKSLEITILTFEGLYPYNRDLFLPIVANTVSLQNVYYKPDTFYESQHIKVMTEKKPDRINYKRKIVFMEDKEQIPYDVLILTDVAHQKFPSIKGTNKNGVYGFRTLKDILALIESMPLSDVFTIQSNSPVSLKLAQVIVERSKEVDLIIPQQFDLSSWGGREDVNEEILAQWKEKGLRVIQNNEIAEILGEGTVKAVRLKSEKVLASQNVIYLDDLLDFKFFQDTPLTINKRICVDEHYQTSLEHVFAVDDICEQASLPQPCENQSVLEEQGSVVANSLLSSCATTG